MSELTNLPEAGIRFNSRKQDRERRARPTIQEVLIAGVRGKNALRVDHSGDHRECVYSSVYDCTHHRPIKGLIVMKIVNPDRFAMAIVAMPFLLMLPPLGVDPLGPGDHTRTVLMGEQKRTYLVHVPKDYDPKKPTPVVLALHGAAMNGSMMVWFSGLNKKSDEVRLHRRLSQRHGRGAVPHLERWRFQRQDGRGQGRRRGLHRQAARRTRAVVKVDEKRVYACGMSNGGMMCYRLAAEMSDRSPPSPP